MSDMKAQVEEQGSLEMIHNELIDLNSRLANIRDLLQTNLDNIMGPAPASPAQAEAPPNKPGPSAIDKILGRLLQQDLLLLSVEGAVARLRQLG